MISLERIQRRFTGAWAGMECFCYEERLDRLDCFALEERRLGGIDTLDHKKTFPGEQVSKARGIGLCSKEETYRGSAEDFFSPRTSSVRLCRKEKVAVATVK